MSELNIPQLAAELHRLSKPKKVYFPQQNADPQSNGDWIRWAVVIIFTGISMIASLWTKNQYVAKDAYEKDNTSVISKLESIQSTLDKREHEQDEITDLKKDVEALKERK